MLVLGRRLREQVILTHPDGTVVTIVVTRLDNHHVGLGIEAPREVVIDRADVNGRSQTKEATP